MIGGMNTPSLAASLLGSLGVAACEPFAIATADGGFVHGRVTGFEPGDHPPHGPLSEHAARGPDPAMAGLDALRRFLAPDVPANGGRFVEYPLYDYVSERPTFGSMDEGAMALGEDFPALRHPPHRLVTQRVASRGLAVEVDAGREEVGAGWAQAQVTFLRGVIDRERLRRTLALFAAGAVRAERAWDHDDADPDADVRAELDAQPLRASRVVYGPGAWTRRDRALGASRPRSPEDLAGELEVDGVQVLRAAGRSRGNAGGQVLLFCADEGLGRNDFSNLKTFTAPARGGGRYAAYLQRVGGERWRVGVECHETVAITSLVGMGIISVAAEPPWRCA